MADDPWRHDVVKETVSGVKKLLASVILLVKKLEENPVIGVQGGG